MAQKRTSFTPAGRRIEEGISMDVLTRVSAVIRVLAHPQRLKMIELLLDGPRSVGELADVVGLAPAAASQHLNNMKAHGIVAKDREGRTVYYRVVHPAAESLLQCISRYGDGRQNYGNSVLDHVV